MASPEEQIDSMMASLEAKTGHPVDWWMDLADASGLPKHADVVAMLKDQHGLTYGYANMIVVLAKRRAEGDVDLVAAQYQGKEALRPIYYRLVAVAESFGDDVELAPKKAGVSLRRVKQFALITPATKTRIDLGINLKGAAPTDRLKASSGMCTHNVGLAAVDEVDDAVTGWLRAAYDLAG